MRVLSVFDGISCARVALERAGVPVTTYLSSEIDPHAIAISTRNYPDIVRLGDIRQVFMSHIGDTVDLMIGGSPCQDLSIAKHSRKGLMGDRSGLFWEYVRIKNLLRPRYFILENVASMSSADRDTISQALGVNPICIDAALVSAQSRKRLFWTNLPASQPADRGLCLLDILQPDAEVDESFTVMTKTFHPTTPSRSPTQTMKLGHMGDTDGQANRIYDPAGKSVTLSANGGGGGAKTGLYFVGHLDGTTRKGLEGQEHLSRAHTQPNRVYSPEGKSPTLSASETSGRTHIVVGGLPGRVRKLTPIECERLQGLPDGYTDGVAKTHRYKTLGNAFNVDVLTHLLSSLRVEDNPHLTASL